MKLHTLTAGFTVVATEKWIIEGSDSKHADGVSFGFLRDIREMLPIE
jgi:hypothetical protein